MQSGQAGGQPYYGAHGLYNMKMVMKYQISVVGVVTRQWTGYPRTPSIPSRVRDFSSPKHPGWLFSEYQVFSQWECEGYHSLHIVPRLRMSGGVPVMPWTGSVSPYVSFFFNNCTLWLMCV